MIIWTTGRPVIFPSIANCWLAVFLLFLFSSSRWWSTICRHCRANSSAPFRLLARRCWRTPPGRPTESAVPHLARITFRPTLLDNVRDLSSPLWYIFILFLPPPRCFFHARWPHCSFSTRVHFFFFFYFFPVDERGTLATAVAAVASLPHPPTWTENLAFHSPVSFTRVSFLLPPIHPSIHPTTLFHCYNRSSRLIVMEKGRERIDKLPPSFCFLRFFQVSCFWL